MAYGQTASKRGNLMRECPEPRLNPSHELILSNYSLTKTSLKKIKEILRDYLVKINFLVSTYSLLSNIYLVSTYSLLIDLSESFRTGSP